MCRHDQSMLMGTADGIVCRGCGMLFRSFAEIHPEEQPAPEAEKPKRSRKKKEDA